MKLIQVNCLIITRINNMQINIKTSAANQKVISNLTQKLPGGAKENIRARVA